MLWEQRELLSDRHDLDGFLCGDETIDGWLKSSCRRYLQQGLCSLWVCAEPDGTIIGLFTLASHLIQPEVLTGAQRGGINAVGHPAILLGQLALRRESRGEGIGALLMLEALAQCVESADNVGARFIVLDALNERLIRYYEAFGFRSVPSDPQRMLLKMSAARARLTEALEG